MRLEKTPEFATWLEDLQPKLKALVNARLYRIEEYDHFGDAKSLGDSLAELRWANGLRVYFSTRIDKQGNIILILIGGMKNAQKKEIKQARLLVRKYQADPT